MSTLKVLKQRYSFPEAVERAVNFEAPFIHNDAHLYTRYAQVVERFTEIALGLHRICLKVADYDFVLPEIPALDAAAAALPYNETRELMVSNLRQNIAALTALLNVPQFGRAVWTDPESCQFTYLEFVRDRGILSNTIRRIAHQHDVVKARQHKLPANDIAIPKRGREIIRAIPAPLQPYVRVITGLEVQKNVREDSSRNEATWLGQTLAVGKRQATRATAATTAGIASAGGAFSAFATDALTTVKKTALAVADPAIVIGEICLYGWEN